MMNSETQKSIAIWRAGRRKLFDVLTHTIKRGRAAKQRQNAAVELFIDDFVAETGVDVSTQEGMQALGSAMALHIKRMMQQKSAAQELAQDAEFEDSTEMKDHPF